jgi:hypothetical protein
MNKTLSIDAARSHDSQSANFDEPRLKLSSLSTLQEGVERRLETEERPIGSEDDYCI